MKRNHTARRQPEKARTLKKTSHSQGPAGRMRWGSGHAIQRDEGAKQKQRCMEHGAETARGSRLPTGLACPGSHAYLYRRQACDGLTAL